MRNGTETLKCIDSIRRVASTAAHSPFAGDAFVEVCSLAELAGMPSSYRLLTSAREYAVFQNSEQLAVTLAGRVGNPRVSPVPPLWPLLALLLLGWRHTLSAEQVIERAVALGLENEVQRGLAIVAYLFPELQTWMADIPLRIPLWERTLALPLAARKLALFGKMESPGDGSLAVGSSLHEEAVRLMQWRVTGASRRGRSHVRSNAPNQDAIEYWVSAGGETAVMAVADGHGSALCFRSEVGSRFAVTTAVQVIRMFANTIRAHDTASAIADRARVLLAEELTQTWRIAVQHDVEAQPFTQAEWAGLAALEGWTGQQVVNRHPELAYGSTILAVLATKTYVLCMQLGDGDILFVDSQGQTRRAVPKDGQVAPKQTASLWRQNAAAEVRVHVFEGLGDLPALILVATDGCAESCKSDDGFLDIGRTYLSIVRNEGFDSVEHRLKTFLEEASWGGNGDDTTIGLISRLEREPMPDLDALESETDLSVSEKLNAAR